MPLREMIFEKKVSAGNVIEIGLIMASLIWATAYVKSDVDTVKKTQQELRIEFKAHEIANREQVQINDQIYVRKDVLEQVMKRLDDIQNSLNRLDAKVSK